MFHLCFTLQSSMSVYVADTPHAFYKKIRKKFNGQCQKTAILSDMAINLLLSAQVWLKGSKRKVWIIIWKKISLKVKPFPVAMVKQPHHYVIPTLINNTPDTIIVQGVFTYQIPKILLQSYWNLTNTSQNLAGNWVLNSSLEYQKKFHYKNFILFLLITITLLLKIYGRMASTFLI